MTHIHAKSAQSVQDALASKGLECKVIELTNVEEGHTFTDCTPFFGAKMYVRMLWSKHQKECALLIRSL